jgi:hypothetical protein
MDPNITNPINPVVNQNPVPVQPEPVVTPQVPVTPVVPVPVGVPATSQVMPEPVVPVYQDQTAMNNMPVAGTTEVPATPAATTPNTPTA